MKKSATDFGDGLKVFAEDIKLTRSEHNLPEIWVSDRFRDRFLAYLRVAGKSIICDEIILKCNSGNFVDVHRIVLREQGTKKDVILMIREFLNSIPTDWFEPYHEDSDDTDFEFILPRFSIRKQGV
jgi:hypothetical protein